MKKTLLLCGALIALTATVASAGPVRLAFNECLGAGGLSFLDLPCNSNTGNYQLYASVQAPAGIGVWTSFETEVQVQALTPSLPLYWQLRNQTGQTGQCRNGALAANADMSNVGGCSDAYLGQGAGGIGTYLVGFDGPNRARLLMVFSVPTASQIPLDAGVEYYAARIVISNTKTTGTGSCAGCDEPVALNCTYVKCVQPAGAPGGNVEVHNPAGDMSSCAYVNPGGETACGGATPAINKTWGSVKALYR